MYENSEPIYVHAECAVVLENLGKHYPARDDYTRFRHRVYRGIIYNHETYNTILLRSRPFEVAPRGRPGLLFGISN